MSQALNPVLADEAGASAAVNAAYLSQAKALAPLVSREALAAEDGGHLTAPVVDALKQTGLIWFMLPRELGGGAASIESCIEVIEELGRSDGSSGWSFMATSIQTVFAAGWAGDSAIDAMFGGSQRAIVAGFPGPIGKASRLADGSFRGSGRFPFASGSGYADWFAGGMTVQNNGDTVRDAAGDPETVTFFVPRERVTYIPNWNVLGLLGTGSNDFAINDVTVHADFATNVRTHNPLRGPARYRMGGLAIGAAGHCGVVLGMMKRALEEIAVIASTKSRLGYTVPLDKYPTFQQEFALQEALYTAARARVLGIFAELERSAEAGHAPTRLQWGRMYQITSWLHRVGPEVVRNCHSWSGSAGIREPSAMARCLRNVLTASVHSVADPIKLVNGAVSLLQTYAEQAQDRR